MWILNVLVPRPAIWANTAAWWTVVSGERPIGAANWHR